MLHLKLLLLLLLQTIMASDPKQDQEILDAINAAMDAPTTYLVTYILVPNAGPPNVEMGTVEGIEVESLTWYFKPGEDIWTADVITNAASDSFLIKVTPILTGTSTKFDINATVDITFEPSPTETASTEDLATLAGDAFSVTLAVADTAVAPEILIKEDPVYSLEVKLDSSTIYSTTGPSASPSGPPSRSMKSRIVASKSSKKPAKGPAKLDNLRLQKIKARTQTTPNVKRDDFTSLYVSAFKVARNLEVALGSDNEHMLTLIHKLARTFFATNLQVINRFFSGFEELERIMEAIKLQRVRRRVDIRDINALREEFSKFSPEMAEFIDPTFGQKRLDEKIPFIKFLCDFTDQLRRIGSCIQHNDIVRSAESREALLERVASFVAFTKQSAGTVKGFTTPQRAFDNKKSKRSSSKPPKSSQQFGAPVPSLRAVPPIADTSTLEIIITSSTAGDLGPITGQWTVDGTYTTDYNTTIEHKAGYSNAPQMYAQLPVIQLEKITNDLAAGPLTDEEKGYFSEIMMLIKNDIARNTLRASATATYDGCQCDNKTCNDKKGSHDSLTPCPVTPCMKTNFSMNHICNSMILFDIFFSGSTKGSLPDSLDLKLLFECYGEKNNDSVCRAVVDLEIGKWIKAGGVDCSHKIAVCPDYEHGSMYARYYCASALSHPTTLGPLGKSLIVSSFDAKDKIVGDKTAGEEGEDADSQETSGEDEDEDKNKKRTIVYIAIIALVVIIVVIIIAAMLLM